MTKRLELDIECCYDCPYCRVNCDFGGYHCDHNEGPWDIDDANNFVQKDCPLKDKEN